MFVSDHNYLPTDSIIDGDLNLHERDFNLDPATNDKRRKYCIVASVPKKYDGF